MSVEPYQIRTQMGKPIKPVADPDSAAKYLAKLEARFGKNALTRLHKIENAALRGNVDRQSAEATSSGAEQTRQRRAEWAAILAPAGPVMRHEAAALWDIASPAADSRLQSLEAGGFAVRVPGAKPIRWQIVEAAE